ncbi:MAG: hypothetical protein HQL32_15645 [Planctomycetes bacterium]|nr:hypothetical protein [Planctomycetota bacterium]
MNLISLDLLINSYLDGDIETKEAKELASIIRSSSKQSQWIMDELAMRGWLAQALNSIPANKFKQSFLERLNAEEDSSDFLKEFERRQATGDHHTISYTPPNSLSKILIFTQAALQQFNFRLNYIFLAAIVLIPCLWFSFSYINTNKGSSIVTESGPGVQLIRKNQSLSLQKGTSLTAGDRLITPLSSGVFININEGCQLSLKASSELSFVPLHPARFHNKQGNLVLEKGDLEMKNNRSTESPLLSTSHLELELQYGAVELSTTQSSSLVKVLQGVCHINERGRLGQHTLFGGQYFLINSQGLIEKNNTSMNHLTHFKK